MHTDILVVGRGLIGSATARFLSELQPAASITSVGWTWEDNAHSSHRDEGRIVRPSGHDPVWTHINARAIHHLTQTGAFEQTGAITGFVGQPPDTQTAEGLGFASGEVDPAPLNYPGATALLEPAGGILRPASLIHAHERQTTANGGTLLRGEVRGFTPSHSGFQVDLLTHSGPRSITTSKLVIAAGAFSGRLLHNRLPITIKTESTWLARIPDEHEDSFLQQFGSMPGWIDDAQGQDAKGHSYSGRYLVGPRRFADYANGLFIKLGADLHNDSTLRDQHDIDQWFAHGLPNQEGPLRQALADLWPQIGDVPGHVHRCMVTYTRTGYPVIDQLEAGLYVAAFGNGYSAMASCALGELAARQVLDMPWTLGAHPVDPTPFSVRRAQGPRVNPRCTNG